MTKTQSGRRHDSLCLFSRQPSCVQHLATNVKPFFYFFCNSIHESLHRLACTVTSSYLSPVHCSTCEGEWPSCGPPGYQRASEQRLQDQSEREGSGWCSSLESPWSTHCRVQSGPALSARAQVPTTTEEKKSKLFWKINNYWNQDHGGFCCNIFIFHQDQTARGGTAEVKVGWK